MTATYWGAVEAAVDALRKSSGARVRYPEEWGWQSPRRRHRKRRGSKGASGISGLVRLTSWATRRPVRAEPTRPTWP